MNKHETTDLISEKDAKLIKLGLINNLLTEMVAVENSLQRTLAINLKLKHNFSCRTQSL